MRHGTTQALAPAENKPLFYPACLSLDLKLFSCSPRLQLAAAGVLPCVAFVLYARTAARTITWLHGGADGAELAAAALVLGVSHPTGYPLYMLLGHLFTALPFGEVVFRVTLLSAVSAAVGVGLASAAAWLLIDADPIPRLLGSASAGTLLAVAPLYWTQATIAETYALNAAFVLAIMALLGHWEPRADLTIVAIGAVAGLALANHLTIVLLITTVACYVLVRDGRLLRRRAALVAIAAMGVGPLLYLYLPLRAATDPALNWGDPQSFDRFLAHVSARAYQPYFTSASFSDDMLRVPLAMRIIAENLTWPGLAAALLGIFDLRRRHGALCTLLVVYAALTTVFAIHYRAANGERYLLPVVLVLAVTAGVGVAFLAQMRAARLALTGVVCLLVGWQVSTHWAVMDISADRAASVYARDLLAKAPMDGEVRSDSDATTFALWYAQVVEGQRPDVQVVDLRFHALSWFRENLERRNPAQLQRFDDDFRALGS